MHFAHLRGGIPGKPALVMLLVCTACVCAERKLHPPAASTVDQRQHQFASTNASNGLDHSWPSFRATSGGCDSDEECIPAARCTMAGLHSGSASLRPCTTAFNTDGICCGTTSATSPARLRRRSSSYDVDFEHVCQNAIRQGRRKFAEKLQAVEKNRQLMTSTQEGDLPDFHRYLQPHLPSSSDHQAEDPQIYEAIYASRQFAEATNMTLDERQRDQFGSVRDKRCLQSVDKCDPRAPYRTLDGTCNNLHPERTSWGAAGHPFEKLLPPAYEDGIWAPRLHSVSGRPLTSARTISAALLPDLDRPHPFLNLLTMQFGQFVSHDITRSNSIKLGKNDIECCARGGTHALSGEESHFACLPIEVSPHDPYFSQFGVRCLNFVRLALAGDPKCRLGYAKQVSRITHFIDGSTIYGSSDQHAHSLRSFRSGQLRNTFPLGIERPPFNRDPGFCEPWARVCFEAGDDRANQIISLTHVHTLFLREHNRVAGMLAELNPSWNDETVYQETRKIVIAQLQKIIYNEYLPLVVGSDKAKQYGLLDESHGYSDLYNQNVKPVMMSEVVATALRFGHSTVQGNYHMRHRHAPPETIPLHSTFNDPSRLLTPTNFDDLMYSLGAQPQQQTDPFITRSLTQLLFAGRNPFGSDLAALNIQRGRDHALRPYNDYRQWAGLPRIRSFEELGSVGAKLAQLYESPDDIDLYIGALLLESDTTRDGLVGETFGHLIAEQFARLKFGDRFHYKNNPDINAGALRPQELEQIERITLAGVICANVDRRFDFYQAPRAFFRSSVDNVPVPCAQIRGLDLRAWVH